MKAEQRPLLDRNFGWIPDLPDHRDHALPTVSAPPPEDKIDLSPMCPPVLDQKNLGSCTAFMTLACARFTAMEKGVEAKRLSELYQYYNSRVLQGTVKQDSGASIRNAFKALARWGSCLDTTWPYQVAKFKQTPPNKAFEEGAKRALKPVNYMRIGQTAADIQGQIAAKNPVGIGFTCYDNLTEAGKTGIVPMPEGSVIGGHAILLVGYDREKRLYKFLNSWGRNWGDKGFGYIPFDYVHNPKLASDFWILKSVPY